MIIEFRFHIINTVIFNLTIIIIYILKVKLILNVNIVNKLNKFIDIKIIQGELLINIKFVFLLILLYLFILFLFLIF